MKLQNFKIVLNAAAGVRREKFDGEDYLVVNTVLMTPGIHTGNEGPINYTDENLAKYTPSWNHKPVFGKGHPVVNGQPVSASNVKLMEEEQVGFLLNMDYDKRQKGETWLNERKAGLICPDVLSKLSAGQSVEGSTGLFVSNDGKPGENTFGKYNGTALEHRPDHYAILTDSIGACSNEKGGGLLINSSVKEPLTVAHRIRERLSVNGGKDLVKLVTNTLSFQQITSSLSDQLRARFGKPGFSWWGFVNAVYDKICIYDDGNCQLYRISYSIDNDKVILGTEDPTKVEATIQYQTEDGKMVVNRDPKPTTLKEIFVMNRDDVYAKLIGEGKPFKEADKVTFAAMSDEAFGTLAKKFTEPPPVVNTAPAPAPPVPVLPPATPVVNTAPAADGTLRTWEDIRKVASPQVMEVLDDMLGTHQIEKTKIVTYITNAKGNAYTPAELNGMKVADLKKIASLIPVPASVPGGPALDLPNFAGAHTTPVINAAPVEPLGNSFVVNWADELKDQTEKKNHAMSA